MTLRDPDRRQLREQADAPYTPPLPPMPPSAPQGARPAYTPLGVRPAASPLGVRPAASPLGVRPADSFVAAMPARAPLPAAPSQPRKAIGPVYRGLPKPVRIVGWIVIALVFGAVIGATAPTALMRLGAVAALQPSLLAWYSVRALGFLAYFVVAGSVLYGLLLSTKILDAIAHRPVSFTLHKDLALVGLLLATLHAVILLADTSFDFTPRAILVPFASPYAATWVGIGQITFYGFALITASFYVRRQIGQRAWRMLHYLTFLAFIGATAHGIMSGSDSGSFWAFWVYLVPGAVSVFLLTYRITISIAAHSSRAAEPVAVPAAPPTRMAILFPGGRVPSNRGEAPSDSDLA